MVPESLRGGDGDDILTGGRERDELVGEDGSDEFNSYFEGYPKPADAPALGDDQLTQMASTIAAGKGPHGPGGHGGPPPPRRGDVDGDDTAANLSTLAGNLGLSSDELLEKLQSGTDANSLWGASTNNPYAAAKFNVPGGVAVDTYA